MYYSFICICIADMASMSHTWSFTNIPHFCVSWMTNTNVYWQMGIPFRHFRSWLLSICAVGLLSSAFAINVTTLVSICMECVTLIYVSVYVFGFAVFHWSKWKQGKSEGFDSCDRPSNLKLDSNRWFFSLCDLEIWWMTSRNNRALFLW